MTESSKEERGPKSPGVSLGPAVELLRKVREGVGFGRASRETVANALGYGSLNGRSQRAIAALLHFGLVERSGANAVQISELGKKVLMPNHDSESVQALAEAAKQPTLYGKLFERYSGQAVPALLTNILVREFGVLANSSEEVAKTFRESVDFAGLLRNGVLYEELEPSGPVGDKDATVRVDDDLPEPAPSRAVGATVAAQHSPPVGAQAYTIALDRQGRVATIYIPLPVLGSDLKRIERWATFMAEMAEDDMLDGSGK
jgi:hypothetical protein